MLQKTKKRVILKNFFKLLFLLSSTLFALENYPYIGGVAVIDIGTFEEKPKVFYNSYEAKVIQKKDNYFAVIGIGLNEKVGKKHIVAVSHNKKLDFYFYVKSKSYKKEYIKLKSNKRVTLSKKNLARFHKEKAKTKKLLGSFNKTLASDLNFVTPVVGRISSPFGKKRYFNNKPKAPHSGIDIATKRGTPIVAAESGYVAISEAFFFNGNTIYLDHGEGVITIYCHMSKVEVYEGDFVNKGDVIGYVGTTGRSTGPHLHFGVVLNSKAVDPKIFINDYAETKLSSSASSQIGSEK
jgi:murein DD-endopeptidase MepM/ murein hydrolase activator NlpD